VLEVHIVSIDNGDTEPELWAFKSLDKAHAFGEARANNWEVYSIPILNDSEADELIESEREIPS
jgi:hypothetical protein